jgi:hypothetical protein
MKIEIYDPAMCCSSGVCGPSVSPGLVRIQETLRQIQKQAPEVQIMRYGLSTDPKAFVSNATVAELLKSEGPECLPLVFVGGELISKGSYASDSMLQEILGESGIELELGVKMKKSSSCCEPGCCC